MKPPKIPELITYVSKETTLIEPDEKSHFGQSVPEIVFTHGNKKNALKNIIPILPLMIPTLINMKKSYRSVVDNPPSNQDTADISMMKELEQYAKKLGCREIGYTQVPREYIFSNKKILFNNAIILTIEMDKKAIDKAPTLTAGKEVWLAYRKLGKIVNKLSDILRKRGYPAQAGPALGGDVNYPLLAQKAGLGRIGRHGLLISEEVGSRQRIAAVYTNIKNLPYTDSDKYKWIDSWCQKCRRCVQKCPGEAIYENPEIFKDGTHQHINLKKCAVPFSENYGCTVCIKECTFNISSYDSIRESYEKQNSH